jgi:hypothetical protein
VLGRFGGERDTGIHLRWQLDVWSGARGLVVDARGWDRRRGRGIDRSAKPILGLVHTGRRRVCLALSIAGAEQEKDGQKRWVPHVLWPSRNQPSNANSWWITTGC